MKTVPEAEFDKLLDLADDVSRDTWARLAGHDATAALHVIGTLFAAVERELGWSRRRIVDHIFGIADACTDEPRGLSAVETPNSVEGVNHESDVSIESAPLSEGGE